MPQPSRCSDRFSWRRSRALLLASFLALPAALLAWAASPLPQVLVVSSLGDWRQVAPGANYANQPPLTFGQRLDPTAGCIYGTLESSIVLKYTNPADNSLYPTPCDRVPPVTSSKCKPITSPPTCPADLTALQKPVLSAFAESVHETFSRLLTKTPERYMVATSRGLEEDLSDAVVPVENGQIDLRAAFHGMAPGTYFVTIVPVDARGAHATPLPLSVTRNQKAPVPSTGLHPGLYKLVLVDRKGEPAGSDAWILIASGPGYAARAAQYQKAVDESAKLPPEMDPSATRALLRGYLESLSETAQVSAP